MWRLTLLFQQLEYQKSLELILSMFEMDFVVLQYVKNGVEKRVS